MAGVEDYYNNLTELILFLAPTVEESDTSNSYGRLLVDFLILVYRVMLVHICNSS